MKFIQKSWIFISVFALLWGFTAVVHAQEVPPNQQEQEVPPDQQEQGVPPDQQEQVIPPNQQEQGVREDFSDDELQKFVSAATKVQEVQQVRQQEMISAIEEEDLDVQRFNEIMAAQQGQAQNTDISDEEMEAFNLAMQKVMEKQEKLQTEVEETIEKEGISTDTYEEIMIAYQQSPKVQEKVTKLLQEEQ